MLQCHDLFGLRDLIISCDYHFVPLPHWMIFIPFLFAIEAKFTAYFSMDSFTNSIIIIILCSLSYILAYTLLLTLITIFALFLIPDKCRMGSETANMEFGNRRVSQWMPPLQIVLFLFKKKLLLCDNLGVDYFAYVMIMNKLPIMLWPIKQLYYMSQLLIYQCINL